MDRMKRMRDLAESNPAVYAYAFAWLAGAASVNTELDEHLDKAIHFVERTYPRRSLKEVAADIDTALRQSLLTK